ncbi:MAG: hypothetical protein HOI95_25180 [Chromatiales bacterium]|jgi:crotonobetainyl-CoA:carnitine CoA-transferase CaiB-like acyl-CoA transferase|nr:hypothetical protein [Chromatiales bacterium]
MTASSTTGGDGALQGLRVLEAATRTGVRVCGSLLAQMGAQVVALEAHDAQANCARRAVLLAGKQSVATTPEKCAQLAALSDVILLSHDEAHGVDIDSAVDAGAIVVNISSFAGDCAVPATLAGAGELAIQALSGMMETTGLPDGAPTVIDGEPLEFAAALHGLAGALGALLAKARDGRGQRVDVALLDCAISSHAVFMSKLTEAPDAPAMRTGNRHLLASPWNVFQTNDGWLLICLASEVQWQRLCGLMGNPSLAAESGFDTGSARAANMDAVEAHVQAWVGTLSLDEVSTILLDANIPCGAVAPVDHYPREANLTHRQMVTPLTMAGATHWYGPGRLLHASRTPGLTLSRVPLPHQHDGAIETLPTRPTLPTRAMKTSARNDAANTDAPLSGIRVIELGHYTTAPLTGRYLANLGAEVIKVEAPGGEAMRAWAPQRHGAGTFFVVNNTGKRSVVLDLKNPQDLARLEGLIRDADVVVENLKPGALARMGLPFERMQALNASIIYCAVCGFGADSIYPGRPAYDTVIQAMAGVMDRTRADGVPVKTGMSLADVMGSNISVGAILSALLHRNRTGKGQFLDVSMQDVAAWATQLTWNGLEPIYERTRVAQCSDGYVLVTRPDAHGVDGAPLLSLSREEAQSKWPGNVWPIQTLNEAVASPLARHQVQEVADDRGRLWPVLINPIRLSHTPLINPAMGSDLGADNARYFSE